MMARPKKTETVVSPYFTGGKGYNDIYETTQLKVSKASGSTGRTFVDWDGRNSVKSDYSREDYDWFRSSGSTPEDYRGKADICNKAYKKVGIIKNVVDLMSDFASKGIRLRHPNQKIEKFFNEWFKKVSGKERSERFLNQLYRLGCAPIYITYGKITPKFERAMMKAMGSFTDDIQLEETKLPKRLIPLRYTFMNPCNLELMAGNMSGFLDKAVYGVHLTSDVVNNILHPTVEVKRLAEQIAKNTPEAIRRSSITGNTIVEINPDNMYIAHYKKDDWEDWADSIIYSIIDDLVVYDKMRLADISALDGAISNVRLWNVGHIGTGPHDSILPTKETLQRLRNILANNVGGGTIDLVWGPELKFTSSSTDVHKFLGSEKYKVTLDAIYEGLGIPSVLRNSSSTNNSSSYFSLKTLIERLQYGRDRLVEFWEKQIEMVQKAMGFLLPATIEFDVMVLADEAAEKQLLLHMWDRDIIADDALLERANFDPDYEAIRTKRSARKRGKSMPPKASPFHNANQEHDMLKLFIQAGLATPSQVGLELESPKDDELASIKKLTQTKEKPVAGGVAGRPRSVTETKKRKAKPQNKPAKASSNVDAPSLVSDAAASFSWANEAQKSIASLVTPSVLHMYSKKNVRSLTKSEYETLETAKATVLFNLRPFQEITQENVYEILENKALASKYTEAIKVAVDGFAAKNDRQPTIDEKHLIYSLLYSVENPNG